MNKFNFKEHQMILLTGHKCIKLRVLKATVICVSNLGKEFVYLLT